MGACSSKPKTRETESPLLEPTKKTRAVEVDAITGSAEKPPPENLKSESLLKEGDSTAAIVGVPQENSITDQKEKLEEAQTGKEAEVAQDKAIGAVGAGDGGIGGGDVNGGKAAAAGEDQAIGGSDVPQKDVDPPAEATDVGAVLVAGSSATETDDAPSVEPTDACKTMEVDDVPSFEPPHAGSVTEGASIATEKDVLPSVVTTDVSAASDGEFAAPEPTLDTTQETKAEIPGAATETDAPRHEENKSAVEAEGFADAPGESGTVEQSTTGTVDPTSGPSVEEPDTPVEPLVEKNGEGGTAKCVADGQLQETKAEADKGQPKEGKAEDAGDSGGQPQESKAEASADESNSEGNPAAKQVNEDLIDREPSFKDASDMPLEPELSPPQ